MINKIKNKFITIGKIFRLLKKNTQDNRDIKSHLILSNFKFENIYIPFNSYSLNASAIVDILNDILLNNRKSIIEFGSGIGTLYIAKLIQLHNLDIEFISIDSDEQWINLLKSMLVKEGIEQYVDIRKAPIKKTNKVIYKNQNQWYDIDVISQIANELPEIDVVIVDGPPGHVCDHIRYTALPFLKSFLADDYYVFLDDTNRVIEREVFEQWEFELNNKGTFHGSYSKMLSKSKFITHLK